MHVGTAKITAAYLFILVICALTLWATNSPAALWAVLLAVAMGVLCVVDSFVTAQFSHLSFELRRTHDENRPLELVASLSTPHFVTPSRIEVDVVIDNRLFGTQTSATLVLRSAGRKPQTFVYAYPEFACGKVDVRVERVSFFDTFGFTFMEREIPFKESRLVYPRSVSMNVVFDRSPQSAFSGASFDMFKKGVDKSETLDVRPYREGDDPREVHWKLSAKMGELFVREPSRPTDYNVVMLLGLGRNYSPGYDQSGAYDSTVASAQAVKSAQDAAKDEAQRTLVPVFTLDRAIALFASLSNELVHGGVGHAIAVSDGDSLRLDAVESQSSWGNAIDTLLSLPLAKYSNHSIDLYAGDPSCAHFTKVVYVTTEIDTEALRRLSDHCDITVFLVGDVSLSQSESFEHCDIVSLAPDQLEGRVETLSV